MKPLRLLSLLIFAAAAQAQVVFYDSIDNSAFSFSTPSDTAVGKEYTEYVQLEPVVGIRQLAQVDFTVVVQAGGSGEAVLNLYHRDGASGLPQNTPFFQSGAVAFSNPVNPFPTVELSFDLSAAPVNLAGIVGDSLYVGLVFTQVNKASNFDLFGLQIAPSPPSVGSSDPSQSFLVRQTIPSTTAWVQEVPGTEPAFSIRMLGATVIPEPATLGLLLVGLGSLLGLNRLRGRRG